MAKGPARTVEQSAIRMPVSGPGAVAASVPESGVGLGAIGLVASVSPKPDRRLRARAAAPGP